MKSDKGIKLVSCLLGAALVISPLQSVSEGAPLAGDITVKKIAGPGEEPASPAKASISLEKAITLAKEKVPVPADLDGFKSEYYEQDGNGRWVLRWHKTKAPDSNMQITVDSATGEIVGISLYRSASSGVQYRGLPAYSKDQCLDIARQEARKFQPERYSSTVLTEREGWEVQPVFRDRDYPIVYDFYFQRTHNGVPVSEQGINVGMNAETGELMRYESTWDTGLKLPSPEGKVSPEVAKKAFMDKSGHELTYFLTGRDDPDAEGELKLAYRQKPPGRFVLNALTGEIIDKTVQFYDMYDMRAGGGDMMLSSKSEKMSLTPSEKKAVEENRDFISADRAQEFAAKLVKIPDGFTAKGRDLERNYGVPGSRVWNISYRDKDEKSYIRVSVDAKTGDLVSFNIDQDEMDIYKAPEVNFSEEQAVKTAEEFIKKMQPARFGQVVFRQSEAEPGPWIKLGSMTPRAYSVQYARMINGVVYPENGFRVTVSAATGEIINYDMTWWETEFPAARGVIGTASANERFLKDHPLVLEYGRGYTRWGMEKEPVYYLIYKPKGGNGAVLDASTGVEIDYRGKPVVKKAKPSFSDISGHSAENDILLLAQEGIISGDGGKFRPDDPVTGAEALAMLVKAYGNQYGPVQPFAESKDDPWYKPVVERALALGILDKDFTVNPDGSLNRLQLARMGVNAGGWGKLARIHGIFKLDVADVTAVPLEYRGYAAAAVGMGLVKPESGKFMPDRAVTRGEAASFLVKLLKQ